MSLRKTGRLFSFGCEAEGYALGQVLLMKPLRFIVVSSRLYPTLREVQVANALEDHLLSGWLAWPPERGRWHELQLGQPDVQPYLGTKYRIDVEGILHVKAFGEDRLQRSISPLDERLPLESHYTPAVFEHCFFQHHGLRERRLIDVCPELRRAPN